MPGPGAFLRHLGDSRSSLVCGAVVGRTARSMSAAADSGRRRARNIAVVLVGLIVIGLGVDRLLMLFGHMANVREVIAFPTPRPDPGPTDQLVARRNQFFTCS